MAFFIPFCPYTFLFLIFALVDIILEGRDETSAEMALKDIATEDASLFLCKDPLWAFVIICKDPLWAFVIECL